MLKNHIVEEFCQIIARFKAGLRANIKAEILGQPLYNVEHAFQVTLGTEMYLNFLHQVSTSRVSFSQKGKIQCYLNSNVQLEKINQKQPKATIDRIIQDERNQVEESTQSQATTLLTCPKAKVKSEYPDNFFVVEPDKMKNLATSIESNESLEMSMLLPKSSEIVPKVLLGEIVPINDFQPTTMMFQELDLFASFKDLHEESPMLLSIHFVPLIDFIIPENFNDTIKGINFQIFSLFLQLEKKMKYHLNAFQRQLHIQVQRF
ncbi:unnamed protein product [Ilex paraguariensis]|uniref:Uncharacterized protein n=1 Tax=Ilex paraguariensis TaxID=185542 RepID=A0ABC8ST28_9AQUA